MRLPHDEGAHLSGLEWWYFNGHLATENGQEFSYHFVTFQSVLPSNLTPRLAQLSWADHVNGLHLTEEKPDVSLLEPLSGEFDLPIAGWRMSGNGELYHLNFGTGDYAVELEAVSQKPAVLHHGAGLVDLGHSWQDLLLLAHSPGNLRHGVCFRRLPPCHGSILDGPPVG